MKKKNLAIPVAILSMAATNIMASECPKDFQEVTVSGEVNTQNIPETEGSLQQGTIDMQLTSVKNDKVLFDQRGAVLGHITGFDFEFYPPVVLLDHDITFAHGGEIETNGDRATVDIFPPDQPNVGVVEVISNFWGSKTFKNATGEIVATGLLTTFDDAGNLYKYFELSGSLCISK
jgi:hypothetical protein